MTEVYGDVYLDGAEQVYEEVFLGEEVTPQTDFDNADVWRGGGRGYVWKGGTRPYVWTVRD
jgi:hypothetical protein